MVRARNTHAHRLTHLDFVRDALAPEESDEGGAAYVEAVEEVAAALSAVVTVPTSKSKASSEVAGRVSASTPDHRQEKVDHPRVALLNAYFRVNGPTSRTLFRDWMKSDTQATADLWRGLGDLVRVQVDNRRYDLPEALVDTGKTASKPDGVVLVPPNDPYLRQVDRTLLVPDSNRRQQVWRALSGPGALLVDGEVAGTWRYRRSDHEVTITPFDSLAPAQRTKAEKSAHLIAEATGDEQPTVTWV